MFFFILFIVFLIVVTRHYAAEYRMKAIQAGEADLSPRDKSILPLMGMCKIGSYVVFTIMLASGIIMILAQFSGRELFSLSQSDWSEIHLIFVSMFIALFVFLTYVHWNWFRKALTHRSKAVNKQ
jgi:uncharacterized protein YqhQ